MQGKHIVGTVVGLLLVGAAVVILVNVTKS